MVGGGEGGEELGWGEVAEGLVRSDVVADVFPGAGMTEGAHQIASNPLPPGERRPGSVGLARGVEVAIVDALGCELPAGGVGEVVIRGRSVTSGYERVAPELFMLPGGWLRTGDQGCLGLDGYLSLTGRLKEMVNRGGEKIAPREVEDALLAHPAVLAVGHSATPAEIRTFAARRLAAFKVPRKLVVTDTIPLGPTGKPLRVGMAERLGLD
ncbi:MAG: AMP-binding protein [Anaerolineaceae bacterium]